MKPLVVILAGGIGKSFAPLSINKTLIPIFGKPMLQHVIEMAEFSGFQEALIITNSENEAWLSSYQPFNITLRTRKVNPTGMGGALLQAEGDIGNQPIVVMNAADMIEPIFFKSMMRQTSDSYSYVTGLKVDQYFPGGYIKMEGTRAVDILEKPGIGKQPSDLLNLVFHYFSEPQDFLSILKKTPTSDQQYEIALSNLMQQRHVDVLKYPGRWQKLKYAHHVLDMMQMILDTKDSNHRARTAYISPHAVLEGNVFVDEDAHIDAYAVIKGPAYIGKGTKIGNHVLIRQSSIEAGSIVGFGSEVARSYIGPNCMLHHNFVGDSVLESDINPSWGTTFANWRLDNDNVKLKHLDDEIDSGKKKLGAIVAKGAFLGVNCSVMPGTIIGRDAKIFPNKVVKGTISEGEIIK